MNLEIYTWDTKEKQSEARPYGFVDFPENFLNIFLEKRQKAIESIKQSTSLNLAQTQSKQPYSDIELQTLDEFDSSRVIATLYNVSMGNKAFSSNQLRHFWRLLKKADLRKLTSKYNSDFKNTSQQVLPLREQVELVSTFLMFSQTKTPGYLQALSTALKLNDFIISEKDKLSSSAQAILLISLELENQQVRSLKQEISERNPEYVEPADYYKRVPKSKVENLGMLLQETNRSKAYLQSLIKSGLLPNFVLLLKKPSEIKKETLDTAPEKTDLQYFDLNISEEQSLQEANIPYKIIQTSSCNDEQVVGALKNRPEQYFVFSGRGILSKELVKAKKLIHSHPGKIPAYRGSTCPYYSFLAGEGWHCTSFIMKPEIDEGEVITVKQFPLPKGIDATRVYDPYTRSAVLVDTVQQLAETGTLKTTNQDLSKGITYYVIHPVLEFIAKNSLSELDL